MTADFGTIGQVGLGLLGGAIGRRLRRGGFSVKGFDIDPKCREAFVTDGGIAVQQVEDVLRDCRVILLSLPHSGIVSRIFEEHKKELREGQVIIDTTTGNPDDMERIGRSLSDAGATYLEANVAGSSRQMEVGVAVLLLGGEDEAIATVKPILDVLSKIAFRLGGVGSASRFKLVHNMVLGLHRAVLAEGLAFAEGMGFKPRQTLEILQQTPASSAVMTTKGRKMVERDWHPEAKLSQHLKDVRLILQLADELGCESPLSRLHENLLERAEQAGWGERDNSAIFEVFSNRVSESRPA